MSQQPSGGQEQQPWKQLTVLAVDDEPDVLGQLQRLLVLHKFNVATASSGQDALDWLESNNAHVVISDQRMPLMTGNQFLATVAQKHPHTIRLVLSGYAEQDMILSAMNDAGATQYIMKPWEDVDLVGKVSTALQLSYANAERKRLAQANERLIRKQATLDNYSWFGSMSERLYNKMYGIVEQRRKEVRVGPVSPEFEEAAIFVNLVGEYASLPIGQTGAHAENRAQKLTITVPIRWCVDSVNLFDVPTEIDVALDAETPSILIYPKSMRIAIKALIENAVLHNSNAQPKVSISSSFEGDDVVVRVRDNGNGVAKPSRIFEPLYTGHGWHTKAVESFTVPDNLDSYNFTRERHIGLGLAFARYCITQHDGTVELEENGSAGSCFKISIPSGQSDLRQRLGIR